MATAIAGVRTDADCIITTVWPSVACTALGRLLGGFYDSIPLKINGVKLSYLLFVLPTAPIPLLVYLLIKVTGERYVLTTRAVQRWTVLGTRLLQETPLTSIVDIAVRQQGGQSFYHAADLHLLSADGGTLMRLEGVSRPDVFRQNILEARDAQRHVAASLATINARHRS